MQEKEGAPSTPLPKPLFVWKAAKYEPFERFPWMRLLTVLISSAGLGGVMFWMQNLFGAALFPLAGAVSSMVIFRKHSLVSCAIFEDALVCHGRRYSLVFFRGFAPNQNAIFLLPKNRDKKPLRVPVGKHGKKVQDILEQYLPQEEHIETLEMAVGRFFRF